MDVGIYSPVWCSSLQAHPYDRPSVWNMVVVIRADGDVRPYGSTDVVVWRIGVYSPVWCSSLQAHPYDRPNVWNMVVVIRADGDVRPYVGTNRYKPYNPM